VPLQGVRSGVPARRDCGRERNALYPQQGGRHVRGRVDKAGITRKQRDVRPRRQHAPTVDDDGWVDAYVANDSNPSALYRNNHDGTSPTWRCPPGARTARTASPRRAWRRGGRFDRNGPWTCSRRTSPRHPRPSTAPHCRACEAPFARTARAQQRVASAGGTAFVASARTVARVSFFLRQRQSIPRWCSSRPWPGTGRRKVVYRVNVGGRFEDVASGWGARHRAKGRARARASATNENDGRRWTSVINNVTTGRPLTGPRTDPARHWLLVKLVGTTSNRRPSAGACGCVARRRTQVQEVRGVEGPPVSPAKVRLEHVMVPFAVVIAPRDAHARLGLPSWLYGTRRHRQRR